MASGSFSGSGSKVALKINWSSTKGTGGSTVSATLYAVNNSYYYFDAQVNQGYYITIDGSKATGNTAKLSSAVNGTATLKSHSKWVAYTGNKSITISGYANLTNINANGNLGERSVSGTAALDKVGSAPPDVTMTAPTTYTDTELASSVKLTWTRCNDYSGKATYRIQYSVNGGAWTTLKEGIANGTLSYTDTFAAGQGRKIQYRIDTHNDIGASAGWAYSGTVTKNSLSAPTIGTLNTYNPYVNATLSVPLSGGSQTNGGAFARWAELYDGTTKLATCSTPSNGNTSASITYAAASYLARLGKTKYSGTFKIKSWIQNDNGSKSATVEKTFTVNINSDGGANPTLGNPTLSGGALGYPTTCFIAGVSSLGVSSPNATLRRQTSDTTVSYKIECTGKSAVSGQSTTFTGLGAGTKTIKVTATDSRGLSVSKSVTCIFQSYASPQIKNIKAERLSSPNTSGKVTYTLSYSPIYANGSSGTNLNGISIQQMSKAGAAFVNYTSGTAITGCATGTTYKITIRIADKVKTTSYIESSDTIPTIKSAWSLRPWGVGIQCIPQNGVALDVVGDAKIDGTLGVTSTAILNGKTQINTNYTSNTWLNSYKGGSIINSTGAGSGAYIMLHSYTSPNGVFALGGYQDTYTLSFASNSLITAGTNNYTQRVKLLDELGRSTFVNILATDSLRAGAGYDAGNGSQGVLIKPQGGIELSGGTPYIDFHYNNSTADYTSRLIATNANTLECTSNFEAANFKDSGWRDCTLEPGFERYYTDASTLQVRKIGNIVNLRGTLKNTTAFTPTGDYSHKVASMPIGYPTKNEFFVCHGSGSNRFLMAVSAGGNIYISRYSNNTTVNNQIPANSWLNFYATWFIG